MDYSKWVERAKGFIEDVRGLPGEMEVTIEVKPSMTRHEVDLLAKGLPLGLPNVIKDFLSQGSASCECNYVWEPDDSLIADFAEVIEDEDYLEGGATLCLGAELASLQEMAKETATYFTGDDQESRIGRDLWGSAFPFVQVGNGDSLALLTSKNVENPPVVYLGIYGGCEVISPSFSEFLYHWERICYVGPEGWFLSEWRDPATGHIDSKLPKTTLLRRLMKLGEAYEFDVSWPMPIWPDWRASAARIADRVSLLTSAP
ncbi:MAG: SMI1/KNR4 family protein [Akkermansiaceae bacterium]